MNVFLAYHNDFCKTRSEIEEYKKLSVFDF
jgi:hypothetical protein